MSGRVIVVGGGIAGASTAFALARRGVGVTVVDDARVGSATVASAGIVAPWVSAAGGVFYELYAAGAAFYPRVLELLAEVGITQTHYRRTGALLVSADPGVLGETERRVTARVRAAGAVAGEVQRLDSAQVRALVPPLAPDLAGVLVSGGARVDGRTMCEALLAGAVRHGARCVTGFARLVPRAAATPMVEVDGRRFEADEVVVASGAWVNELIGSLGVRLDVAPQRGQITHLRLDGVPDTGGWPSVHPLSHHYLVAFNDSRVVVGATRETGSGFDPRVTAAGLRQVLDDALRLAPGLADATIIETRVGLRPLADFEEPIIGRLKGGVHVVTGFGAAGLTLGPLVGDAVARAIVDGSPPAEITPFSPARHAR